MYPGKNKEHAFILIHYTHNIISILNNQKQFEVKQGQLHLDVQGKEDCLQEHLPLHCFLHLHLQSSAQDSEMALRSVQKISNSSSEFFLQPHSSGLCNSGMLTRLCPQTKLD